MKHAREHQAEAPKHGLRASLPRFGIAAILLVISGLLMLVFSRAGDAFFPAYRVFSKAIMGGLAALSSCVPFSIWDWLAIPLALALVITLITALVRTHSLWRWFANVCVIASAMVFFLVGAWGLNHYAPPLSDELNLTVQKYSGDELATATRYYLEKAGDLAAKVPREEDYSLTHQDFYELAAVCGRSYAGLAGEYPLFEGSQAPIKALLLAGEPLLYWGNNGIFWPFTGESSVPLNCADAEIPFTMCHEAAHRLGIASEQEANFAAFLACVENDDVRLAYAGYLEAFGYCYNALVANYPERAKRLIDSKFGENADISDPYILGMALVFEDRRATREHYQHYEGPIDDVGATANDVFLKAFNEEEGVKSYGKVVDYLIAWYQERAQ